MAVEEAPPVPFFVAGGTVPPGSPSYVERAADGELADALLAGEFCYVLNSRQMGKSSLAVRAIARLQAAGVRTAFVDLTRIGAAGATPERWYAGLLLELGRALGMRERAMGAVKGEGTPAGKLFGFLNDALAAPSPTPSSSPDGGASRSEGPSRGDEEGARIVVFVDEVDAARTLPFPADDLFAGVRQAWNARATDPRYDRLAFCLMGAALPSDLIRDPRMTPFNVGRRVELRDFTPEEARPFASQVGEAALARVLHWTGGHPFLTQALCAELATPHRQEEESRLSIPHPLPPRGDRSRSHGPLLAGAKGRGAGAVDALVRERYLDARAREADTNLADVGNRLLGTGDPDVTDEDRAATLTLYERILRGKPVADDESNPSAARIKMSGVARVENGLLKVRNRIYATAFDARWVKESLPGGELRRQRKAFWRGALRTGLLATTVLAVVSTLAVVATRNAARATGAEALARRQRDAARYDAYVASMQTMAPRDADGDLAGIRQTLAGFKDNPARGWEWDYWSRAVDHGASRLDWEGATICRDAASARCPFIAVTDYDSLTVYEAATGRRLRRVPLGHCLGNPWQPNLFRDGRRVLISNGFYDRFLVVDMDTGRILVRRDFASPLFFPVASPDEWNSEGDRFAIVASVDAVPGSGLGVSRLDLGTLRTTPIRSLVPGVAVAGLDIWGIRFGGNGRELACEWRAAQGRRFVSILRATDLKEVRRLPVGASLDMLAFSPLGSEIVGRDGQTLVRLDTATGRALGSIAFEGAGGDALYAPDGHGMLVSMGNRADEYDLTVPRPRLLRTIPGALGAYYLPGGRFFLDADPDLMILDPSGGGAPTEVRLPGGPFYGAGQSADGRVTLVGANRLLSLAGDRPLANPMFRAGVQGIDASGRFAGRVFAKGDETWTETIDLRKGRTVFSRRVSRTKMHPLANAFAGSPDGRRVALPTSTTSLGIYDAADGALVERLDGIAIPKVARFSDDGRWLAVGDLEGNVAVWDSRNWRRVAAGRVGRDTVLSLAFMKNGTRIAGGTSSGLGVLDFRNGASIRLDGLTAEVRALAWSEDGRRLAAAGGDQRVRLWDPATGRSLGVIGSHEARVIGVWFTADDQTLCSVDTSGVLKLWATGDRL